MHQLVSTAWVSGRMHECGFTAPAFGVGLSTGLEHKFYVVRLAHFGGIYQGRFTILVSSVNPYS